MRKELYGRLKAVISEHVPEVQHIDLWNHNVEFLEQEAAWARPAVFVEFGTITWRPLTGPCLRGTGVVRLHLVTDWNEGEYGSAFDLGRKIRGAVEGLSGEEFDGMVLSETETNHNHEDILENIDTYGVRYILEGEGGTE